MSKQVGGISDKQGNTYENRFLARNILRLISEDISSIVVEPTSEHTSICEFYTKDKDGTRKYYQCKCSNGTNDHWNPSDLQKFDIYKRTKKLLLRERSSLFVFVSPLPYKELDELCSRARQCQDASEFINTKLTNNQLRTWFAACEKYFDLSREDPEQLNILVNILSRCEFIVRPDDSECIADLNQIVSFYFLGKPDTTRILIENYVNDSSLYGVEITESKVLKFLSDKNIQSRKQIVTERIAPTIDRLNQKFSESYSPINSSIFHRDCTDKVISEIKAGNSVVVHGKAGVGKSGCVRELINYLETEEIDYLALQLDKDTPTDFADKYGQNLGLPESPVTCLYRFSGSKQCVLILDQLDALRWTAMHSSNAIDVCKEMILQTSGINMNSVSHISIVFSVRTFDYDNDVNIRSLFTDQKNETKTNNWAVIEVNSLSDDEVVSIIGKEYYSLPSRVQSLLHIPSSLYVWLRLDSIKRKNQYSSTQELVMSWWNQLQEDFSNKGNNKALLSNCIDEIVRAILGSGYYSISQSLLINYTKELDFLSSGGMLLVENNSVSFVHQSFLDTFFLSRDIYSLYNDNKSFSDLVFSWGIQTPVNRYRLSALLQNVIDSNQSMFVGLCREFLQNDGIHFYYKVAIFEIIGQFDSPNTELFDLIDEYYKDLLWHPIICRCVYTNHPLYIKHLSDINELDLLRDEDVTLLASIKKTNPNIVLSIISSQCEKKDIPDSLIMRIIGNEITDENKGLFDLRLKIYLNNNSYLLEINYIDLDHARPEHVIQIFEIVLNNFHFFQSKHIYLSISNRDQYCKDNADYILSIFDLLCRSACNTPLAFVSPLIADKVYWYPNSSREFLLREIVELVKSSLKALAINDPPRALDYVSLAGNYRNGIANELALSTLFDIPIEFSNSVIEWLLSDFDSHILDCVSDKRDYLSSCKRILKKFSPNCSMEIFSELENRIVNWKGEKEHFLKSYKNRLELNKSKKYVYYPMWGHLQKALLPNLDQSRITKRTQDLIRVLNRNEWVVANKFHYGILSTPVKMVTSSIHDSAVKLSDNTWLRIINSDLPVNHSFSIKKFKDFDCESSHEAFSRDLEICTKSNPERFAKLLLKFPLECYEGYYVAVLDNLHNSVELNVDYDLLQAVVNHCIQIASDSIIIAVANVIRNNLELPWSEDTINYLLSIASGKYNTVNDELRMSEYLDPEKLSPEDLFMAMYNSPRGIVLLTLSNLLSINPKYCDIFAPTIKKITKDKNLIVNYSLVECAYAYYKYNPSFAMRIYNSAVSISPYALCERCSFWLMNRNLTTLKYYYFYKIKKGCSINNPSLTEQLATQVCATVIITKSIIAKRFLFKFTWSNEAINNICQQAINALSNDKYRIISQKIIAYCIEHNSGQIECLSQIFNPLLLNIERDKEFVNHIIRTHSSFDTIIDFIKFLNEQACDIADYLDALKTAVNSIDNTAHWQDYMIEKELTKSIIKLIDELTGKKTSSEYCLELLDIIYKKRIFTDSAIIKLIDGDL